MREVAEPSTADGSITSLIINYKAGPLLECVDCGTCNSKTFLLLI